MNRREAMHRRLARAGAWVFVGVTVAALAFASGRGLPAMETAGAAFGAWNAALTLWSGSTLGYRGRAPVRRGDRPARYWLDVATSAVVATLFAWLALSALKKH